MVVIHLGQKNSDLNVAQDLKVFDLGGITNDCGNSIVWDLYTLSGSYQNIIAAPDGNRLSGFKIKIVNHLGGLIYTGADEFYVYEADLVKNVRTAGFISNTTNTGVSTQLVKIKNLIFDWTPADKSFSIPISPSSRTQMNMEIGNMVITGDTGDGGLFTQYFSSSTGEDCQMSLNIENIIHEVVTGDELPVLAIDAAETSYFSGSSLDSRCISSISGHVLDNGVVYNYDITDYRGNGYGFLIDGEAGSVQAKSPEINIKIKGRFTRGMALSLMRLNATNSIINVHMDVVCEDSACVHLFNRLSNPSFGASVVTVSGRIETKKAGYPCIYLGEVNPGGNLILKDITLINDGTVPVVRSDIGTGTSDYVVMNGRTNYTGVEDAQAVNNGEAWITNALFN